jgi:hypothetical protein
MNASHPRRLALSAALAAGLGIAGCASTQLDAQWSDPQLAGASLRGAKVLVACEAAEAVVKRICQDRLADEVIAHGGNPVLAAQTTLEPQPLRSPNDEPYLSAARAAGARAVLATTVAPTSASVSPGFTVGLGGFGVGSGGLGGGIGVSAPIGGGQVSSGYSASARITSAETGRLLWTAKASSPPSGDVNGQLAELARTVMTAAGKAGLF